jgi:predicted nicotinamide N-methyase
MGRKLSVLAVASIDELLDQVVDEDDIPFWAEIWPSSLGLIKYLARYSQELRDKTVLELGCGVGVLGIAAQLCGGILTQSDYMTEALQFASVNASRNGLKPAKTLLADWRSFHSEIRYDWIIGSDILYEKKLHPYLYDIFDHVLAEGGRVVLADPGRGYARQFINETLPKQWVVDCCRESVDQDGQEFWIDLYTLRKTGPTS